ncbi:putative conjugal transfer protein/MT3759 [bacterium BMS3Abin02]|nr:putative conjugal transfer protein/MT3759 [bacterium BMS3Abin02]
MSAYEDIRSAAIQIIERRKLDVRAERELTRVAVTEAVGTYQRQADHGGNKTLLDPAEMIERVFHAVADFGSLTDVLTDPGVEEIFIEGDRVSSIDGDGRLHALSRPTTEEENRRVVDRLLADTDRHLDVANPIVQARVLRDSARLTAVMPPIADRLSVTIRRYALRRETLTSLVELGSMTPPAAGFLWAVTQANSSIIVSGPPGSGKTSMLAALIAAIPPGDCLRSCEEVRELHVPIVHGSYYEARPPSLDGSGAIPLRDLVKIILAMRPDRIVVGEVRGAEAFELTRAVNAGCGFSCTVHANSAREALSALVNAALMAGENVTESVVRNVFASSIDFVVHLDRDTSVRSDRGLRRRVMEVLSVVPSLHDDFTTEPIFLRSDLGGPLEWTGVFPPDDLTRRIQRSLPEGMTLRAIFEGRLSPL